MRCTATTGMTSSHPLSALSSALLSLANEQSLTAAPLFDAALAEMAGEEKKETTDAAAAEGGKAGSRATAEEVARVRLARAANSLRLGRYTGTPQQPSHITPHHTHRYTTSMTSINTE